MSRLTFQATVWPGGGFVAIECTYLYALPAIDKPWQPRILGRVEADDFAQPADGERLENGGGERL